MMNGGSGDIVDNGWQRLYDNTTRGIKLTFLAREGKSKEDINNVLDKWKNEGTYLRYNCNYPLDDGKDKPLTVYICTGHHKENGTICVDNSYDIKLYMIYVVNIKIRSSKSDGIEFSYELERTKRMKSLMKDYCWRDDVNINYSNCPNFYYQGFPIEPYMTPISLGMKTGDVIVVGERPTLHSIMFSNTGQDKDNLEDCVNEAAVMSALARYDRSVTTLELLKNDFIMKFMFSGGMRNTESDKAKVESILDKCLVNLRDEGKVDMERGDPVKWAIL